MADEVPVRDVLCEAMEYLSKLGTNLRTRSDSLKEKRISKEKLKNTHAIQKAAQKVLLICELSKKSLDNVENGVKNLMSVVDASQASTSVGAKTSSLKCSQSKPKYHHFVYGSRKLRIIKKIPLKHYLSLKVMARRMPNSMQDKYPVYHDCKLYRLRAKEKKSNEIKHEESHSKSLVDSDLENYSIINKNKEESNRTKNKSLEKRSPSPLYETKSRVSSPSVDNQNQKDQNSSEIVEDNTITNDRKKHNSDNDQTDERSVNKTSKLDHQTKKSKFIKKKRKQIEDLDMNSTHDSEMKQLSTEKKGILSQDGEALDSEHTTLEESSIKKSELNKTKNLSELDETDKNESKKELSHGFESSDDDKSKKNKDKHKEEVKSSKHKRFIKHDKVISDSSESVKEIQCQENCDKEENLTSKGTEKKSEQVDLIDSDKELKNTQKENSDDKHLLNDDTNKQLDTEVKKPLIKCVNITKLLKPDLTNEGQISPVKNKFSKYIENSRTHLKPKKESIKCDNILEKSAKDKKLEDEYWEQKRKEVSAFKPKKIVINVARMPRFSKDFMDKHALKKIISKGSIIFEVISDVMSENEESNNISKKKNTNKTLNINQIKSSLLNDSDSELTEAEKVKNALLNESDSDISGKEHNKGNGSQSIEKLNDGTIDNPEDNKISECMEQNAEQNKDSLLAHSGSDNSHKVSKKEVNNEPDEIKSALLINSMDKLSKTPTKRRRDSGGHTPQSKRKHIMESMHAKKMLLTYSSSSDTDDEQLRSALKEIKKCLLQEISSSDSDENILYKIKKQRELSKTKKGKKEYKEKMEDDDADSKNTGHANENSDCSSSKMGRSKTKPGGSSNQNSDQDGNDKDIDGLTNLKSLTKTRHRRGSSSTDNTQESNSKKKSKVKKAAAMDENDDNNPGNGSGAESDVSEVLSPVALPGQNGDSIGHFAKDDLLGESDSSSSEKDKSSEDMKKENETDEDENVKSRRRKANAISSDSEAGSSRKKERERNRDARDSDFEDSGEDSSEAAKKSKRKRVTDSDASAGASSSDGNKKKRRRIKQIKDSDASSSDSENEGRNKHGRKNIRKVMSKDQLEEATKKAAREEKERIARIAERQKLYNNLEFDESGKPDEVLIDKVVLDFETETKEPLIEVDKGLVKKLKPHQANGIKFMWNACFESVKRIKKDKGSGCILAHCMGLGKTLQVVTLTHTLLTHASLTGVNRVLVVCPLSTVLNWVNEFRMWLKHAESDFEVDVYELSRFKQNSERAFQLQQWFDCGGVCVLGYEMFRNLSADNPKKFRKKMLQSFQKSLVDPGPDLVVCDEGHLLKNEKTSLSQAMNRVRTLRRIVLTGTPLQNNLKEYYCMVQFVKPNLLGKYNEYLNRFVNPITNGQYTDSTEHDIKIMKRRSHVLHKMLDGAVQRRDYGVLAPFLPPKHEYVLFITLTEVQVKLYQFYLDNYSRRPLAGKSSGFLFPDFQSLQRIWTHPLVLKYNSERYEIMQQKKREREEEDSEGSLADFIDDDSTPEETSTEESSDDLSDTSDDSRKKSKKKKSSKKNKGKDSKATTRRGTRANPVELDEDEKATSDIEEVKYENPTEWWIKLVSDNEVEDMRNSHKLVLLFDILRQCEAIGDKLLVFSQSLYSLDLIEHFLGKVDEATQEGRVDDKLGGHVGSWSPGIDYFRLDGSTSCENRSIWCKNFNREDNPRARLFLISTRAGGLGINLVAANRVVIFDVSWNPSHDVQSIFRVYRFGQKKPCYVYRFLAMGTMEEKIYERQVTKQAISKRVIDEQQIDRHYAENDLAELYKFEPTPDAPRPLPALPKDRLFAEMLKEHEAQIYKYHEHDSLLENKEEETLSEEERKAAWEDFENEKNRPPPAPFPSPWPMHLNGMAPGLIAQHQQQLAYAALAAMLRKDTPNINENQIRDMLPLICNSNPALMQKMGEIYKYSQQGMMNPAMMNPVINPAGGGGVGGSSGLQYEPPWQRQQQQQQQMRLHQLMQHQNQMGAKYYAGGLGSRDPVAMALQQQRAREIMLGERAGRPRGRPPLHARPPADAAAAPAPAPASSDVVDLADSD